MYTIVFNVSIDTHTHTHTFRALQSAQADFKMDIEIDQTSNRPITSFYNKTLRNPFSESFFKNCDNLSICKVSSLQLCFQPQDQEEIKVG